MYIGEEFLRKEELLALKIQYLNAKREYRKLKKEYHNLNIVGYDGAAYAIERMSALAQTLANIRDVLINNGCVKYAITKPFDERFYKEVDILSLTR